MVLSGSGGEREVNIIPFDKWGGGGKILIVSVVLNTILLKLVAIISILYTILTMDTSN